MKGISYLTLFFAAYASADEAADRVAIGHVIAKLNVLPQRAALFTDDADGASELEGLRKDKRISSFRISTPPADRPTVTISHEPWGEATINLPGMASIMMSNSTVEVLNPRIESINIRFIAPDVALADAVWTYKEDASTTQSKPLLFVMKREGADWKIASLRVLTAH